MITEYGNSVFLEKQAKLKARFMGPALGLAMAAYFGMRDSLPASVAWVDPRNNDYYLKPGILFDTLKRNPYNVRNA